MRVVVIGGVAAGTALMRAGLSGGDEVCEYGFCQNESSPEMMYGGVAVSSVGLVLGMVLMFQPDSAEIAMKKDDTANNRNLRRVAGRSLSLPGVTFRGTW